MNWNWNKKNRRKKTNSCDTAAKKKYKPTKKKNRNMTVSNTVDQYTIMSGDRSKIKDLLCNRLTECGWRDEVRLLCRNILLEKSGNNSVTVEQLISEVTPKARTLVPDAVKKELLMKIRTILAENESDNSN
ncbi:enhancer of yellow 2 transcription factor [Drosophila innubila]|uniref:enhancer of yellow 2 transcription factor n=1 Tax=Drosophila innubila TaxID=198719 RepID=UPI00148B60EB|nr:enhancer of yellow 2 transcription factor [Drosophila innubila]